MVVNENILLARYPVLVSMVAPATKEKLIQELHNEKNAAVLLVGGSQLSGAGTFTGEPGFGARLQEKLGKHIVNLSLFGQSARDVLPLLPEYTGKPKLILISVDVMAASDPDFFAKILELKKVSDAKKVKLLLVVGAQEPYVDKPLAEDRSPIEAQNAVREFARVNTIPLFDMQKEMDSHLDQGILWWDYLHLTAYGQELEAAALAPVALPLLR